MPLSKQVTNAIWGRSGGRCYVEPTEELSRTRLGNIPVGEVAHIVAERLQGPRGDDPLPLAERNSVTNVILVCPNHHREIDDYPNIWTVERLRSLKDRHEAWVRDTLEEQLRFQHRWMRKECNLRIEFETASSIKDQPRFNFAIINTGEVKVVVHTIEAEPLAVEVKPSIRRREALLATSALIMRTRVSFDLKALKESSVITAGPPVGSPNWLFDPFEVAIDLDPGEREYFTATVDVGDFEAGTFRLSALFWDEPSEQLRSVSQNIGVFRVSDTLSEIEANEVQPAVREARILTFDEVVQRATAQEGELDSRRKETISGRGTSRSIFQRTVGALDTPDARRIIENWLTSGNSTAAFTAVGASQVWTWQSAMIERALSTRRVETRVGAVPLIDLFEVLEPEVFESLALKALNDQASRVRTEAVRAFHHATNSALRQRLSEMAHHDRSSSVRTHAAKAIARFDSLSS